MFQGLSRLQSLDLQGNKLSAVDNGAWQNLPALTHLDISNNELRVMEPETFLNTFTNVDDARTLYLCGKC